MAKKKDMAVFTRRALTLRNSVIQEGMSFPVEVMCESGKYLMVRRPGCMPFVAQQNQITRQESDHANQP